MISRRKRYNKWKKEETITYDMNEYQRNNINGNYLDGDNEEQYRNIINTFRRMILSFKL